MTRALVVWFAMLVVASINGAFREAFLIPKLGDTPGRAISTLMLSAMVVLLTWLTIRWMAPPSPRAAWAIGVLWVALTLAFEFLAGHYLFGKPWSELTTDYNLARGRIWILVLIVTAIAPPVCAALRGVAGAAAPR
jgi:hypothetical protein